MKLEELNRYGQPLGVDAEFRRRCTLASGGKLCDFNFYRRGTAPPTEHLNR